MQFNLAGWLFGCWLLAGWLGNKISCHKIPTIIFVPQLTTNKILATASQHTNRTINGINRFINGSVDTLRHSVN